MRKNYGKIVPINAALAPVGPRINTLGKFGPALHNNFSAHCAHALIVLLFPVPVPPWTINQICELVFLLSCSYPSPQVQPFKMTLQCGQWNVDTNHNAKKGLHLHMTRWQMNRNKRCRNPFTPFWIQVMFSVFRGLKYDDIKPNHAKKSKNAQKIAKAQKAQNFTTLHCNAQ